MRMSLSWLSNARKLILIRLSWRGTILPLYAGGWGTLHSTIMIIFACSFILVVRCQEIPFKWVYSPHSSSFWLQTFDVGRFELRRHKISSSFFLIRDKPLVPLIKGNSTRKMSAYQFNTLTLWRGACCQSDVFNLSYVWYSKWIKVLFMQTQRKLKVS